MGIGQGTFHIDARGDGDPFNWWTYNYDTNREGTRSKDSAEPTIISNVTLKNSTEEKLDDGYADEKERNGELPSSSPPEKIIYDSITEREWTSTIAEGAQIRFAKNMNGYRLDIIFNKTWSN